MGHSSIFKSSDIRGRVPTELDADKARSLAKAFGQLAGAGPVVLGWDARPSSPELAEACAQGLETAGCRVTELGLVTTPCLNFAKKSLGAAGGLMVTASHNPVEENGLKMCLETYPFPKEDLKTLQNLHQAEAPPASKGGSRHTENVDEAYVAWLSRQLGGVTGRLKVVLDTMAGAAWGLAPKAFQRAGFEVQQIDERCGLEIGGSSPDPVREGALEDLTQRVQEAKADLGLAFDGDGDRVVAVDSKGGILGADQTMGILASKVLEQNPGGTVVFDVKMSEAVSDVVKQNGGRAVRCATGQVHVSETLKAHGGVLGGEYSGHYLFPGLDSQDDALYAGLFLAYLVQESGRTLGELASALPQYATSPEIRVMATEDPLQILSRIQKGLPQDLELDSQDGIRAMYPGREGWALARASGTEQALSFRFETKDPGQLKPLAGEFLAGDSQILKAVMDSWEAMK